LLWRLVASLACDALDHRRYSLSGPFFCGLFKEWVVAIIEVRDLVKRYGDFTAVKGISFDVQEGEIFCVVGPNGAGKTTTLEIIETLKDPTSGAVIIDGYDVVKSPWQVKRRIGVQLQAAGFYPSLNLRELLELFAGLYDVHIDAMAMLRKVQLEDKANARYEKLSGGQKQRFSIASTLVNQPRVIFLDEPSTGLDPQARLNLWDLVREIQKDGITVVLTTHYMEEAEQLSDHVAIMDEGKIVASGTPDTLIDALLARGFKKPEVVKLASLEDVFLDITGKQLRDD
jgi:ABC-2 type transport system ATP-binding protein